HPHPHQSGQRSRRAPVQGRRRAACPGPRHWESLAMTNNKVILAIDEGTSGTRAATVSQDGHVSCLQYVALHVDSPRPGVVEQDANDILDRTVQVCRDAIAQAVAEGQEIAAL